MLERLRSYFGQRKTLFAALLWAIVPSLLAALIAPRVSDTELRKVVYAGAATLFFGGFLGGMVKVLLDEVVASKKRREDAAGFVTNVLADLKGVYDRVARAQIVVPAHKSVKTYGDEMRGMIDAGVQLRNVTRALERRAEGLEDSVRLDVSRLVRRMEAYLETLSSEFRDNYKPLSDAQRAYEERAKVLLDRFANSEQAGAPPELPQFAWDRLTRLERLSDFIGERRAYQACFETPLDDASELLRSELARVLGARVRHQQARGLSGQ